MLLSELKGVGPALLLKLHQAGIETVEQLVRTTPVRYAVFRINSVSDIALNQEITLLGVVVEAAKVAYLSRSLTKLTVKVDFSNHPATITLFNREFLKATLRPGVEIVATGKFESKLTQFTAAQLVTKKAFQEGILPEYGLPEIGDKTLRKIISEARKHVRPEETLPLELIQTEGIVDITTYLRCLHEPVHEADIELAKRRIKYEELLRYGLRIRILKERNAGIVKRRTPMAISLVQTFIQTLPFTLTDDQKACVNDIYRDFKRGQPMNRLLQGDVGSGKTMVALIAAFGVLASGKQVAFMAPTEVLARQHWQLFSRLLAPLQHRVVFLSASVQGEKRQEIFSALSNHPVLVVGTHALFQEAVAFDKLGLVIIDEQHRFGVEQRRMLREKGIHPDLLFLSATPIPRTLAITIFAEMDVSIIKALPQGRRPIQTHVVAFEQLPEVLQRLKKRIAEGRQAYVIAPIIQESSSSDVASVQLANTWLESELGNAASIAILHGKLSNENKVAILNRFANNEIACLVATTVVEVGVDVPNAAVMVVLNAERFGLSQLHQLRGRIGRGGYDSECYIVTDCASTDRERFHILEQTQDGFMISEEDLRLRGPGELFGSEQTGVPRFKMANFVTDRELLEHAFLDASTIFAANDARSQAWKESAISLLELATLD
ncbi:MAG: ATP-dependent DNA helicase RecG [Bacillus subtilis]|nr:ATP-dependent DNA helicase RecG [Bacillus subtilis]